MKALSLWQPWDHVVVQGLKPVENRTWAPPVSLWGQPLAIHRATPFDPEGWDFCYRTLNDAGRIDQPLSVPRRPKPRGIVGVVTVVGFVEVGPDKTLRRWNGLSTRFGRSEAEALAASPWTFGPFGWALVDVHALPTPIAVGGHQGLWNLDPRTEEDVRRQLGWPP